MKRSRRNWWLLFSLCTLWLFVVLGWISVTVLDLERSEANARVEARHQAGVRLALWRMDSWLAPYLATEAARTPRDYDDFTNSDGLFSSTGALRPSPLLSFRSEFIRLHFQLGQAVVETCSSPLVPLDNFAAKLTNEQVDQNREVLDDIRGLIESAPVWERVAAAEAKVLAAQGLEELDLRPPRIESDYQQQEWLAQNKKELSKRSRVAQTAQMAQSLNGGPQFVGDTTMSGPLVPVWISASGGPELFFLRKVRSATREVLQGFQIDWRLLESLLRDEVADLLTGARLVPVLDDLAEAAESGNVMATIPVALEVPPPPPVAIAALSPTRIAVLVTWVAILVALTTTGLMMRSSIAFGERRSRFASAVTHELRTPLTTFRMYSEMLAEGMVEDPERQKLYLDTIKDESARLAALVENVLAYSRIEDGRQPTLKREIGIRDLMRDLESSLRRRTEEAQAELSLELEDGVDGLLFTDPDAVGQVLGNLVDNAIKYGLTDSERRIDISARRTDTRLEIRVEDRGPGVGADTQSGLFKPFDRCGRESTALPGVGLGLSLSRELAHALGGTLDLETPPADNTSPPGACFVLRLPVYK